MTKKKFGKPIRGEGKSFSTNLILNEDGTLVPDTISKTYKGSRESLSDSDASEDSEESNVTDSEASSFRFTRKKEKANPLQSIIEIENPNRTKKQNFKISELSKVESQELSRREREAIEKKAAEERYRKLHSEGKTEKAKADLARLAIVRKEREEKARQRKAEQEAKENAMKNRMDKSAKPL
ncbi:hypothetical protein PORY_002323 [Pneumocystis oryctolagi]|uniref:Uncharacterized protein n=1 Tax=Pneumocystis oryctolagi TaxID=42067 RepID=A0ACB7C9W1_9ASCO|nr:hypothetical protein PORY_002323 [Pneumocystis oryctolagi]